MKPHFSMRGASARIALTMLAITQRDGIAKRKRDDGEHVHVPEEELDREYGDGEWLKKTSESGLKAVTVSLAYKGDLNKLRWIHMHDCAVLSTYACWNAAEGGHLHVLEWLHSMNCPWTAKTCEKAAEGGHLEVLKFARANGCKWNRDVLRAAIRKNHFDVVQWLCENGCKRNEWTMYEAARFGDLDIVKYLREIGCELGGPWLHGLVGKLLITGASRF